MAFVVRIVARALLAIFYRRVNVVGLERVPAHGPLVVVANHWNALVDAMLLLATLPRQVVPVAKAPLFRNPIVAPFLWLAGAIPVVRQHEAGAAADPARNAAMFARALSALQSGRAILIFPEGVSQPEPALMPLRTGAARLVLGAEAAAGGPVGVTVLPVGLSYYRPGTFRAARAVVMIGAPIRPTDLGGGRDPRSGSAGRSDDLDAGRYDPRDPRPRAVGAGSPADQRDDRPEAETRAAPDGARVRTLTERISRALRQVLIEAQDRQTLELLHVADAVWRTQAGEGPEDAAARTERLQRILRGYAYLAEHEPGRVEAFRTALERHARDLAALGVSGRLLARPVRRRAILRSLVRDGAMLAVGLPVSLWGLAQHGVPYVLIQLAMAILRPAPDVVATYKLAAGLVLYPLCWAAEARIAWQLAGPTALLVFLATLGPTGFLALAWQERLARARRDARALLQFVRDPDLHAHLVARHRTLAAEMRALAALVPDDVLTPGSAP